MSIHLEGFRGSDSKRPAIRRQSVSDTWDDSVDAVIYEGSAEDLVLAIPDESIDLVVTSPPYNIGKSYETRQSLETYFDEMKPLIAQLTRVLSETGSIVWQVGNYITPDKQEVIPLDVYFWHIFNDLGLYSKGRIVWTFGHGLHAKRKFSGRYETALWFSKSDSPHFDVDPIRVPQKYPNKRHFKGPKKGQLSGNPLGKNPGDVWNIPNVKHNHPEKTGHPCQFPVELAERFVLSMTQTGGRVFDPYGGVGSTLMAAIMHERKAVMSELDESYVAETRRRIELAEKGEFRARPSHTELKND